MDYVDAVTAAAGALRRGVEAGWHLARLTWEHTLGAGEAGNGRPSSSLGTELPARAVTMEQWCRDVQEAAPGIKFSAATGKRYKAIWERFGAFELSERPEWGDAYVAVDATASPEATLRRHADQHLRDADPERKRELLARLQADPAIGEFGSPAGVLIHPSPHPAPTPVTAVAGALRLAVFVLDARMAAQHYARALGDLTLDPAAVAAEEASIDTVLRAWQRLRLILRDPNGAGVVREVEDFLADARS